MFGRTLFSGSRFIFWALAPVLLLFAGSNLLFIDNWTGTSIAVVAALDAGCLLLVLVLYDPKRFHWAARGLTGMVFATYLAYLVYEFVLSGKPWLRRTPRGEAAPINALLGFVIIGLPALRYTLVGRFSFRESNVTPIDPNDPLWAEAVRRARETVPTLRALFQGEHSDAIVKFPFVTDKGECEHVWGELAAFEGDTLQVTIVTPPIAQQSPVPKTMMIPISDLEDWHITMPDGTIRGSFSTIAQIKICRRDGIKIPDYITGQENRLADSGVFTRLE
jgi:uncharacterized protein YegJ (DUF2314 family)